MLVRAMLLLPLVWPGLRVLGFKRMRRMAECKVTTFPESNSQAGLTSLNHAHRAAQLVAIAARHGLYQANCLHQSLPLCWLLRRRGLPAMLKIGVHHQTQTFQAHAWVELDGVPLGQTVTEYSAFNALHTESKLSS